MTKENPNPKAAEVAAKSENDTTGGEPKSKAQPKAKIPKGMVSVTVSSGGPEKVRIRAAGLAEVFERDKDTLVPARFSSRLRREPNLVVTQG